MLGEWNDGHGTMHAIPAAKHLCPAGLRLRVTGSMAACRDLVQAADADGVLSHRQKEPIALAIAGAIRGEGCIVFHIRARVRLGATRDELIEMGGGPSSVHWRRVLACYAQMSAASRARARGAQFYSR